MIINKGNINLHDIKLIVWDLDNTFWQGTISEEKIIPNPKLIDFIIHATDRGIVNSICSKNDFEMCKKQLVELGIWDYFVFPSIEWSMKGQRLFALISEIGLRPANTLFIDDEALNLQQAQAIDSSLLCGFPDAELFIEMERQLLTRKLDKTHEKLKQYQNLQKRATEKKKYADDLTFLRSAGIQISINDNCISELDRIFELINKTNQLNFTKIRLTHEETRQLLLNSIYDCRYIMCKDNFGYYGIIGFYALDKVKNKLEHFLFSCRTIGMGIEKFIFNMLRCPQLTEIEPVTIHVKTDPIKPDWITVVDEIDQLTDNKLLTPKAIFKGPCDLSQVVPFLNDCVDEEFSYVSSSTKRMIEAHNHSISILQSRELSDEIKEHLVETLEIIDSQYFSTDLFKKDYDVFVYSLLVDYGLGLYRNKNNPNIIIPYEQYTIDITDEKNWDKLLYGEYSGNVPLSLEFLKYFRDNFEFIGRLSAEQMISNLSKIKSALPEKAVMILVNGSEIEYGGKVTEVLNGRHKLHKELNTKVRDFVSNTSNCYMIEVSKMIGSSENYLDTINHYKKVVYFNIAKEINRIIAAVGYKDFGEVNSDVLEKSILKQQRGQIRNKVKKIIIKLVGYRGFNILHSWEKRIKRK